MIEQVGRLLPDVVIRWYLLGGFSSAFRGVLERLYFLSDDLFRRLEVVEIELVDDYVYRRLTARQRLRFENAYLTSAGRLENVGIAAALRDHSVALEPRSGPSLVVQKRAWWLTRWSFVVAGLCLVTAGAWISQVWRPAAVFTIVLGPGLSGSRSPTEATDPFSVPRGVQRVMFEIHPLGTRRQNYSAVLKINRTVIESISEIKISNSGTLALAIPITKLKTGTCSLELVPTNDASSAGEEFRFELLIHP